MIMCNYDECKVNLIEINFINDRDYVKGSNIY